MSYVLEKVSIDSYYGNLLLGMFEFLEKNRRVKNVNLRRIQGLKSQDITNWEQKNGVNLPDDLKTFYLASNGFLLTWEYNFGGETLPVGSIKVVPLEEMILLTGYSYATKAKVQVFGSQYFLQLNGDSKVFLLSDIDDEAKVCLVYPEARKVPKIWLADEDLEWHFLAHKFSTYLRMAVYHVGVPYWQFCFTPQGVPPWVEQMIIMEIPHLSFRAPYDVKRAEEKEEKTRKIIKPINKIDPDILNPTILPDDPLDETKHSKKPSK